jgi:uncharacterized protein (DUF2062 family)
MIPIRKLIRQFEHFVIYRIFHVDDTPHRLALGIGLGFFVAWTPTIGLQMVVVLVLATMLGANRVVGLPFVWITNPFTIFFIYYPNYRVGHFVLSLFGERSRLSAERIRELLSHFPGMGEMLSHLFDWEKWKELGQLLLFLMSDYVDLWVGSLLMGMVMGALSYIISYKAIVWYRTHTPRGRRHAARLERKNLERV